MPNSFRRSLGFPSPRSDLAPQEIRGWALLLQSLETCSVETFFGGVLCKHRRPFWWFWQKKRGRFLVYRVVYSSTRAIYFPQKDTYVCKFVQEPCHSHKELRLCIKSLSKQRVLCFCSPWPLGVGSLENPLGFSRVRCQVPDQGRLGERSMPSGFFGGSPAFGSASDTSPLALGLWLQQICHESPEPSIDTMGHHGVSTALPWGEPSASCQSTLHL